MEILATAGTSMGQTLETRQTEVGTHLTPLPQGYSLV